jgi:ATP-binding cassette subfamily B (MDR/TAP) protein 1
LYLGIGAFFSTYLYTSIFVCHPGETCQRSPQVWTSETITSRIRARTLKSLLSQEVSYYQDGAAITLTSDLQTDLDAIQSGISEKVPNNVMYLSCALTGFIVAIVKAWNLGLALIWMLPCLLGIGYLMTKFGFAYIGRVMGAMGPAASFSQEALGGMTTIRSLGAEASVIDKVSSIQNSALGMARIKSLIWGACMAGMTVVIYLGYALCFGFGGQLLRRDAIEAGTLVTVFLS